LIAAAACSSANDGPTAHGADSLHTSSPTPARVASITLTPIPDLAVGDSARVTAILRDSVGTLLAGRSVAWASSNPAVASVDSTGMVRSVTSGATTITATSGAAVATATATVYTPVVSLLAVSPRIDTLVVAHHAALFVMAWDQLNRQLNAGYRVSWTSTNPTVGAVDSTGRVTAVAPGSTTITATVSGISAASSITVLPGPAVLGVDGDWTLTMSPSPSCRARFPEWAQTRTYTASFKQDGADLILTLSSATVQPVPDRTFFGRLNGPAIWIEFPGDTQYNGWASGWLTDRLSDTQWLNVWGGITGTISADYIEGTMDGEINYWGPGSNIATGPTVVCNAKDHVITLQR
jgi:hypothetical protein